MSGFTSDILRDIYKAAVKQNWRRLAKGNSGHLYLGCPQDDCHYREAFSTTGRGRKPEVNRKLQDMRSHGFTWKGRGGEHTAEPLKRRSESAEVVQNPT